MSSVEKEEKRISRRDFAKGAAVVGAGVLASCASPTPQVVKETVEVPVEVTKIVEKEVEVPAEERIYEVVSPLGRSTVTTVRPSPPLPDLKGKLIGFIDVEFGGHRSEDFVRAVEALCLERIEGVRVVELPSGKTNPWHSRPLDGTAGQVAKEAGVDAVIVGIGG
jgi:hypothetical protein